MTHATAREGETHTHTAPPPGVCGVFLTFWRALTTLIAILACPGRRAEGESRLAALERKIARELMRRALIQMGEDPALADQLNPRLVLNGKDYDIDFDATADERGDPSPAFTWRDFARALARHKYALALRCAFTRLGRSPRRATLRAAIHNRRRLHSRRTRAFLCRRRAAPARADLSVKSGRAPPSTLIAS